MAVYAIGDIQGCFDELQALLDRVTFDPSVDRIWLTGDLVNRGPQSLETLRFVKALGDSAITVLGNHDLHLLALDQGFGGDKENPTLRPILDAPDRAELMTWLRYRPLLHHDAELGFTMVHAGLPPAWDLPTAMACAAEVERVLRSDGAPKFLRKMYGNKPKQWRSDLSGTSRLRYITNAFTRMRFVDPNGRLDLRYKGAPGTQPSELVPWFQIPNRRSRDLKIVFGHWSTLGTVDAPGVYALDTGCLWGGELTALRLDSDTSPPPATCIRCQAKQPPGDD
ncbi:MAG: symmetrical bis(5'-nucleosyl)-tetraphosphatase [Pseudomonadota bacterium]|nr:symmetrical bis(5'-nucleosyl)-tetraphosphatase [Pseudomonadota bacterium]